MRFGVKSCNPTTPGFGVQSCNPTKFRKTRDRPQFCAGQSLRDLAKPVGVSATTLSKYERDQVVPGSRQLLALARALGVRTEYLLRPTSLELGPVEYRASRLSARVRHMIDSEVLGQLERWHELLDLFPHDVVPDFAPPREIPSIRLIIAMSIYSSVRWRIRVP